MVNHEKKIAFIHVPKCAGSSINQTLNLKVHAGTGHAGWKAHANLFKDGYFTFSYVRNPWDRMVSLYHYFYNMRRGHQWYGQNKKLATQISTIGFQEFCARLDEFQRCPWSGIHFVPMVNFLQDQKQNINLDFIGKFENLQEDFDKLCDELYLPRQSLPHKNKSDHIKYIEYYDKKSKEMVDKKYARDIEIFNYKFNK